MRPALFFSLLLLCVACGSDDSQSDQVCIEIYAPVCGSDGVTYGNLCEADRAAVEVAHDGEC